MKEVINKIKVLFNLEDYKLIKKEEHKNGRNIIYICTKNGENKYVVRISPLEDRIEEDYLIETEFVHYLSKNHAPVIDVIPSINGKYVECINYGSSVLYVSMFTYAKGILLCDNGYKYRDGVSINEYHYNVGKTLGMIHKLSKSFKSNYNCISYFDKYNKEYIDALIPNSYLELKNAIFERISKFENLPISNSVFGLIHFDFDDGNYFVDMNDGQITVFDFENCMYCWYMYDLANLWIQGTGWFYNEKDYVKRMNNMVNYFNVILDGYESVNDIPEIMLEKLSLFIDMVLIENIVDEFECSLRRKEEVVYEDIKDRVQSLIDNVVFIGDGVKY